MWMTWSDPACDDSPRCEIAMRDEAREALKGEEIWLAIADDDSLCRRMDSLFVLVAQGGSNETELKAIVEAAVELAINARMRKAA